MNDFQNSVREWTLNTFGPRIANSPDERNHRFLEEALELVQALGATREECHDLVDYVFSRDVGDPEQEVGGVMVCLASLCNVAGLDMQECADLEFIRIDNEEIMAKIRKKHAAKPRFGRLRWVSPQQTMSPVDFQNQFMQRPHPEN